MKKCYINNGVHKTSFACMLLYIELDDIFLDGRLYIVLNKQRIYTDKTRLYSLILQYLHKYPDMKIAIKNSNRKQNLSDEMDKMINGFYD